MILWANQGIVKRRRGGVGKSLKPKQLATNFEIGYTGAAKAIAGDFVKLAGSRQAQNFSSDQ